MIIKITLSHNDEMVELKNIGTIVESSPNRRIDFYSKAGDEIKSYDLLDIQYIGLRFEYK